jgi:hypothetical protein
MERAGAPAGAGSETERVPGVGGCLETGRPDTGVEGFGVQARVAPLPKLIAL